MNYTKQINKIILCGGLGSRMGVITKGINKHLLPVGGDKPMVDNAIQTMLKIDDNKEAGILFIVNAASIQQFATIFEDEYYSNLHPYYACQSGPNGIADAIKCGKYFCDPNLDTLVILGDTLLTSEAQQIIKDTLFDNKGCKIWVTERDDASNFGVIELDEDNRISGIVEKPIVPPTNLAVIGVYMFDNTIWDKIEKLKPSARGEYEVTDLIRMYIKENNTDVGKLNGGWNDLGLSIHDYFAEAGKK